MQTLRIIRGIHSKLFSLAFICLLFSNTFAADLETKNEFIKRIGAKSVTLIFTSYYLNNPASAFGHTFLRLNRHSHAQRAENEKTESYDLLDHGINFGAAVTTSHSLLYAVYGLFGMFRSELAVLPFYYKVREYSDAESRDLWEYDLNLSSDELERLVANLWELGKTKLDYYYLSRNCSYFILAAIDTAAPRLRLLKRLKFFVIPADTVQILSETPELVERVHYRPSVRSQFFERVNGLDAKEKEVLHILTQRIDSRQTLAMESKEFQSFHKRTPLSRAKILDAALDYADFRFFKDLVFKKEPESQIQRELLIQRSRVAYRSPALTVTAPEYTRPERGHYSSRFTWAPGYSNTTGILGSFQFRFALHDLTDSIDGYPGYAQIEFFDIRARWQQRANLFGSARFSLDRFTAFQVTSLAPWNFYSLPLSWKIKIGTSHPKDGVCGDCQAIELKGGAGFTLPLQSDVEGGAETPRSLFAFLEGGPELSPSFNGSKARLFAGPLLGLRWSFTPNWVALLTARHPWILGNSSPDDKHSNHYFQAELETRFSFHKRWAAYVQVTHFNFENPSRNLWEEFAGFSWYW